MSSLIECGYATLRQRLQSEAHIWLVRPQEISDPARLASYADLLSPAESARFRSFRFNKDRQLYLVSHALVRCVLSRYGDVDPATWCFESTKHGRPEIAAPQLPLCLRFNLSHTPGLAACVVVLDNDCGIDVEFVSSRCNLPDIAQRMFAEPELADLQQLHGAHRLQRFFSYWTLREAYCKAQGTGLAHNNRGFWFEQDTDGHFRVCLPNRAASARWQLDVLQPTDEHALALAVYSEDVTQRKAAITCFIEP
jgi:4'-phosphopantetheinyl transferase